MPRTLLTPRDDRASLDDLGERTAFVTGQRPGRGRRRGRRPGRPAGARLAARLFGLVLLPAALTAAGVWVVTTPRFSVTEIQVRGAVRVAPERIRETAGIVRGTSIFRLDPGEVARRLATIPELRRADVIRELPNRVVILVEERRPFTLVHAGRLHWLDEEGWLLGAAPEAVVPPVPVISGLGAEELASMRTAPGPKARAAIALIRALLRSGSHLTAEISEIDMSGREGPILYTIDGVEVRLGREDWEERLARLEGVLTQVAAQDVRTVDLRFRDQVVLQRGPTR